MTEGTPSGEETATGETEMTTEVVALEVEIAVQGKCTQQCVLTVGVRPRFHLSRLREDQFTAETVYQNIGSSE